MSKESLQALASEPLPPFEGIDLGPHQEEMYEDNGEVVSHEQDPGGVEARPFQGVVQDNTTITIGEGIIRTIDGANPGLVVSVTSAEDDVAVAGTGAIWLYLEGGWVKTSRNTNTFTDEGDVHLDTYRYTVTSRAGFTTVDPTPTAPYDWGVGTAFYVKLLTFETVSGTLSITEQLVSDNLFVTDIRSEFA